MNGGKTVRTVGGLLIGLLVVSSPVAAQTIGELSAGAAAATAAAGAAVGQPRSGPVAAVEAARGAAQAESRHAVQTDAGMAAAFDAAVPTAGGAAGAAVPGVARGPAGEAAPASTGAAPPETAAPGSAPGTEGDGTPARYDAALHRDPFRPPTLQTTVADTGARTPLERYQIGQLKLVGVVWDTGVARAMVEDSSGLGYIVSAGTPIGSSGGVVRRIEPRRVLIEETITNFYGDKEPRETVMELPEEDRSP